MLHCSQKTNTCHANFATIRRMTTYALIAFDLDGTLADTESVSVPNAIAMLNEDYGLTLTLEYWLAAYHGLAGQALLNRIESDFGVHIPLAEFMQKRADRVAQMFAQGVQPAPGMLQSIRQLVAGGRQLCVCSNSTPERIALTLQNLTGQRAAGLMLPDVFRNHSFSAIGTHGHGKAKPQPDVYLEAATFYQTQPSACLAVEDSATGVHAALAAGFSCVAYTGLIHNAHLEIPKLIAAGAVETFAHWDDFLPLLTRLEQQA